MNTNSTALSLADVEAARSLIAGGIRKTLCHRMPDLPELGGIEVWLKRDDLQRTRSFKERGALHGLLRMTEEQRSRGVVAASAGNHALGLAYHGGRLGVRVTVVMPAEAPQVKVIRCRSLGAEVVLHPGNFDAAQEGAERLAQESGRTLIHPFDDWAVMAGQGTMALEIVEVVPSFETMVVPVGGGGLLAGMATVIKTLRPEVKVIAVQSEQAAGLVGALREGGPVTVPVGVTLADGLAVARVGRMSFAIAAPLVDRVVTVTESEITAAVSLLARSGVVAEGAGAAGLAAVLAGRVPGWSVVVPVSGGNVDPRRHEEVVTEGARLMRRDSRAA